ncbi:MAG: Modification methylase RsrI [Deltaproteobacteria bacterium ADurb.Bin002]|nr:MAG: Modification methylase RsrI [Deltaproteobacteria bacterium ADurb.Bin002]
MIRPCNSLLEGDCLEIMPTLENDSIDAIIADPPYQTTACKWDICIPFEPMWEQLKRITKKNGAIVLFGSQPFTSALVMSNPGWFKYSWVWNKVHAVGFQIAKYRPMQQHEDVLVFGGGKVKYNPIMTDRPKKRESKLYGNSDVSPLKYVHFRDREYTQWYPKSILEFSGADHSKMLHPTQKPVALIEYLIRTYTNEGETVLDFCAGSGTTGIAALNTNRNYILIEKDPAYCEIIRKRIEEHESTKIPGNWFNSGSRDSQKNRNCFF